MKLIAVVCLVPLLAVWTLGCTGGSTDSGGPRTRMTLEPEETADLSGAGLDSALDEAITILERRLDELGVDDTTVARDGERVIAVEIAGDQQDVEKSVDLEMLGRTGLLQFCEPLTDEAGNVAVVTGGDVVYKAQTCEPARDHDGAIIVESGGAEFVAPATAFEHKDRIVWQPATGELDGVATQLTGRFLEPPTIVRENQIGQPSLVFAWNADGAELSEQITRRLADGHFPVAFFLDGEPIRGADGAAIAPTVQSVITNNAQITGLSREEAEKLSMLLNSGALPVPVRVVEVTTVGDEG